MLVYNDNDNEGQDLRTLRSIQVVLRVKKPEARPN